MTGALTGEHRTLMVFLVAYNLTGGRLAATDGVAALPARYGIRVFGARGLEKGGLRAYY